MDQTRTCSKCGELKLLTLFSKNRGAKLGYKSYCKQCHNTSQRSLQKRKKEESPDSWKEDRYAKHLKSSYGLTPDEVDAMLLKQGGGCAICGIKKNSVGTRLFVDHCHSTGNVRGILCYHCNTLLGLAKDNVETLKTAISYLEWAKGVVIKRNIDEGNYDYQWVSMDAIKAEYSY